MTPPWATDGTAVRDDYAAGLWAYALTEDEADAVCLADYAEHVGRQEELQLRGPRGGKLRMRRTAAR